MKKLLLLKISLCVFSINTMSQEVCKSSEQAILDLNNISIAKCTVKESKNKENKKLRQISVTLSANRRRIKKRKVVKKKELSILKSTEVFEIKETVKVSELPENIKSLSLKTKIENLENTLSTEELKKTSRFSLVDKIPLFGSCKKAKKKDRISCFNQEMVHHISKHFNYPSEAIEKSIQGDIWVRFIIDKNGEIKNIKTFSPKNGELLSKEAIRVVSKLAQFTPAIKDGERISVKYGFPIKFALEE